MARESGKQRKRKRTGSKKAKNLAGDDPARIRDLAIRYAIALLKAVVAQERIALAATPDGKAGGRHTERLISKEIADVPSIESIRELDPAEMLRFKLDIDEAVARSADSSLKSLPSAFVKAESEREFVRVYSEVAGSRAPLSPQSLNPLPKPTARDAAWNKWRDAENKASDEKAKHEDELDRLHERQMQKVFALLHGRVPDAADLKEAQNDRARLEMLYPPPKGSRVRNEVGKRLGLSPNTVRKLAKETHVEKVRTRKVNGARI